MSKFKVGDRVRIKDTKNVRDYHQSWGDKNPIGKVYKLTSEDLEGYIRDWSSSIHLNDNEYGTNFKEDDFELVTDSKPKFKVGDKVKYCDNLIGIIGCIHGNQAYMSKAWNEGTQSQWSFDGNLQGGKCAEHRNFAGYLLSELNLLEAAINNEPSNSSENKVGKIMSNIKEFVKNLALSADEKLLRKHGFKNSCGEYTQEAKDFATQKQCEVQEAAMIEVAKGLEAEEKANK